MGYFEAIDKFQKAINMALTATKEAKQGLSAHDPQWWRLTGRDDMLIEQLELLGKWIGECK
jgi:hypothetical protein